METEIDMNVGMEEKPTEGKVARAIESATAKIPSDLFLWAGLGAIALSLGLRVAGKKNASVFVGEWVPTVLLLGVYNKLVKVAGHDRGSRELQH